MGIKEKLMQLGMQVYLASYGGANTSQQMVKVHQITSALHSINTLSMVCLQPLLGKPEPSTLDLNGQTPANNYKNNATRRSLHFNGISKPTKRTLTSLSFGHDRPGGGSSNQPLHSGTAIPTGDLPP